MHKQLQSFDPATREYKGVVFAHVDMLESAKQNKPIYINTPDTIELPCDLVSKPGFVICLKSDNSEWEYVVDKRGAEYWLGDEKHTITEIGEELPDGAALEKPAVVLASEFKNTKEKAGAAANSTYAALMREMTGGGAAEERDTWPVQLPIAQQIVAGAVLDADDAGLADSILKPGETRETWAAKVVAKNRAVKRLIGTANHILRTTLDAIAAAETAEAVAEVMANAKSQADAAKADFLKG